MGCPGPGKNKKPKRVNARSTIKSTKMAKTKRGECKRNNKIYKYGEQWMDDDDCNGCLCHMGGITCTEMECLGKNQKQKIMNARSTIESTKIAKTKKGECKDNNKIYKDGDQWMNFVSDSYCRSLSGTTKQLQCTCYKGGITCTYMGCFGKNQKQKSGCKNNNNIYKDGDKWMHDDGCNMCHCSKGRSGCTEKDCLGKNQKQKRVNARSTIKSTKMARDGWMTAIGALAKRAGIFAPGGDVPNNTPTGQMDWEK
jgi:hypothetical protein